MARGYTPFFAIEKRKNAAECIFFNRALSVAEKGLQQFWVVFL